MITFARRRYFSGGSAPPLVSIFGIRVPNDSTFTAREWPGRPVPAWPERSRQPQSFAEWFLTTMPVCMITFGARERSFRTGAPFFA
jgi:hypothetical protein